MNTAQYPDSGSWHTVDIDEALSLLHSDCDRGLNPEQVTQRQHQYGANEIQEAVGRNGWRILLDQFTNIMLLMLIAVAIVSGVLSIRNHEIPKDAIAIFAIVILNGLLGYFQESRAEKALAALKQLAAPNVRVLRAGNPQEISAKDLVPGDILLLEAGGQVAADGRLLAASNLQVRESALTGEAQSVSKQAKLVLDDKAPLGDRTNLVFQGTEVVQGRATVLVTETGMKTELGRIAALLQSVETEPTPLQQRMNQLGNTLVAGSLTLVLLVVVGGVLQGGWDAFESLLEVSLSMAVAVVPEGLPAVITVTLAIGTQRMVRRHALIRKLPAVETLGSVTTICSDKTGTLTQNKMVVEWVQTLSLTCQVTGEGYGPSGGFYRSADSTEASKEVASQSLLSAKDQPELQLLLLTCLLCNDAILQKEQGDWAILGDPTEGALLALAGKGGFSQTGSGEICPRVAEFPFSSERKRMSVVVQWQRETGDRDLLTQALDPDPPYLLLAKGSPEMLLERCVAYQKWDQAAELTAHLRSQVLTQNEQMASRGLRVLGLAYRGISTVPNHSDAETAEQNLVWLGLVGMRDAPRPEVAQAVARCRQAGIRPVMITGDHQLTAQALAKDLGIVENSHQAINGRDLETLDQAELQDVVNRVSVYARVSPEHKLRIVQALQTQHQIVAMTGDGVNDAPALKQADIGIAMGITGTDVSKEASDMVLLDDNFATIVAATEEGRVVYANIRRFVKYILGSNIGEVLTIAASPILLPILDVPLTPLQILWMNLVTDGFPALALAMEPAEPNVMKRPPYHPKESIFARGLGAYMVRIGIVFTIVTITLMYWAYHYSQATPGDPNRWKTMVFTTLCLAQMGHAIAVRSNTRLTLEMSPVSNPYVLFAVSLTTILQMMLVYVEPLRNFFGTQVLSPTELAVCFGFSSLMFVWVEFEKLFLRWVQKHNRDRVILRD